MSAPALMRRREVWVPTLWGWLALAAVGLLLFVGIVSGLYPFLAMTAPVPARVLVVEGWISPRALNEAAAAYKSGGYALLVTTGGPIHRGWFEDDSDDETYADQAAKYLRLRGVPTSAIVAVPSEITEDDRTFHSALRVRDWARRTAVSLPALDIVSAGPHARRSRLLYQIAFGKDVKVGAIAVHPYAYDPHRWWRTSSGAKDVYEQAAGLLWVKLFFRPSRAAATSGPTDKTL